MGFDFYTSFANKSNAELLQVILQKELYQPAAVEAAEKILASRTVTEEERAMAINLIEQETTAREKRKERNEQLRSETAKAIYNVVFPRERKPSYFIRFFAIAFFVLWLIVTIPRTPAFDYYWSDGLFRGLIPVAIDVATLLMIYWLFRLNKKGWVLCMIYFTVSIIETLHILIKTPDNILGINLYPDRGAMFTRIIISGLIVYFFNRRDVLDTLQVSRPFQLKVTFFCLLPLGILVFLQTFSVIDLSYYFG